MRFIGPFLALGLILCMLWGAVGWFSLRYGDIIAQDAQQELRGQAINTAQEIDASFDAASSLLHTTNLLLMERGNQPAAIQQAFALVKDSLKQKRHGVVDVLLGDAEGHVYALQDWTGSPLATISMQHLVQPIGEREAAYSQVGLPIKWEPSGDEVIPVLLKLNRPLGKLTLAYALIDVKTIQARLLPRAAIQQGAMTLVRADGLVILRVPEAGSDSAAHIRMPSPQQAATMGHDGTLHVPAERSLDHLDRIGAFSHLQHGGLVFVSTRSTKAVLEVFHRERLILLSLVSAASLVAIALTALFTQQHRRSLLREASLQATSNAVPLGLFRSDALGNILYANETYLKLLGLEQGAAAWDWLSRVPEDQAQTLQQRWLDRAKSKEPLDVVMPMRHTDGSISLLSIRTAPVIVNGRVLGHAGAIEDITVRTAQQASAQTLSAIMELTPDYICQFDPQYRTLYLNPALRERLGLAADVDPSRVNYSEIFAVDSQRPGDEPICTAQALDRGYSHGRNLVRLGPNSAPIHVDTTCLVHKDELQVPQTVSIIMRDISFEVQAEQNLLRQQTMLNAIAQTSTAMIAVIDKERRLLFVNQAFQQAYNLRSGDYLGRHVDDVLPPDDGARQRALGQALQGETVTIEREIPDQSRPRVLAVRVAPMRNDSNEIEGVICIGHDITESREEATRLTQAAQTDPLTGVLNRGGFSARASEQFELAHQHDQLIAVLYIDLDRFKPINDEFGHAAGDRLLIAVSRRLRRALRPQDLLARLGGDEFAVLLPHLRHASDAATVADKLVQAVSTPFMVDAQSLQIGASIGFSVARGSSAKLEEMVLKADAKLYEAKRAGRNGYRGDTTEEADQPG